MYAVLEEDCEAAAAAAVAGADDDEDEGQKKARLFSEVECRRGQGEKEFQAVQYLALVRHRHTSTRVMADNFAGPGQICFGPTGSRRVDLCLVNQPGHVTVYQVHEQRGHVVTGHREGCKLKRPNAPLELVADTAWNDDFNRGLAAHITATGLWKVEYKVITECDFMHGNELLEDCSIGARGPANGRGAKTSTRPVKVACNKENRAKSLSAEAMTRSEGGGGYFNFCPTSLHGFAGALSAILGEDHVSNAAWLPGECDNPNSWQIEESDLLQRILDPESEAGGFVTIKGGEETVEDLASEVMGFCLQRGPVSPEELGLGAVSLMRERVRLATKKRSGESESDFEKRIFEKALLTLDAQCETDYTLVRRHFKGQVTLPVEQFRWLVAKRGLAGYQLVHYIHYPTRHYLRPFILDLLQQRHTLKLGGDGKCLRAETLKLVANGFYGYSLIR